MRRLIPILLLLIALPALANEEPLLCEDSGKRCHVLRQRDCAWCNAECHDGSWAFEKTDCPPRMKSPNERRAKREEESRRQEARNAAFEAEEVEQERLRERRKTERDEANVAAREALQPAPGKVSGVVDRFWKHELIDTAYALVTITNNTSKRVSRPLAKCTAIGPNGSRLGVNQRSVFAGLNPGESESVEVPIDLNGATLVSMDCKIRW